MSELANLLARYGYGPQQPEADQQFVDTSNVLARMPKANPLVEALRIARDRIPENKESAVSLVNMLRGGLDTASNWLDYRNKLSPDDYKPSDILAPLGAGVMGSAFAPQNALGIFGGRLAKTADHAALAKAEEMAAKGADRKAIWDQTGWFQGVDGKWRFEIDDSNAWSFDRNGLPRTFGQMDKPHDRLMAEGVLVGDVFKHPDLYAAYPEAARIKLESGAVPTREAGSFDKANNAIGLRSIDEASRGTLLHELQHAVQEREGFAPGSSPVLDQETQLKLLKQIMQNAAKDAPDAVAAQELRDAAYNAVTADRDAFGIGHALYKRMMGEVEARNAQKRMGMSAEDRRALAPWETEDTPWAQQVTLPRP